MEPQHPLPSPGVEGAPQPCLHALDAGSGEGLLTRELAAVCEEVTALDLAQPEIGSLPANVHRLTGDLMTYPLSSQSFTCVAAIAILHHLPLEAGLRRLAGLVAPGGVLVVLGLYRPATLADHVAAALAWPVSRALRLLRGFHVMQAAVQPPAETLAEIRAVAASLLPGAEIRRQLLHRYLLVWRRPA